MPKLAPVRVKAGVYLTNGKRLVYVRRVIAEGPIVEDCALSMLNVSVMTFEEIAAADWRVVKPKEDES